MSTTKPMTMALKKMPAREMASETMRVDGRLSNDMLPGSMMNCSGSHARSERGNGCTHPQLTRERMYRTDEMINRNNGCCRSLRTCRRYLGGRLGGGVSWWWRP